MSDRIPLRPSPSRARLAARAAAAALTLLLAAGAAPSRAADAIHVIGSFNNWDTGLWTSDPGMTRDGSTWRDTLDIGQWHVERGYQQFKFVTDRAWDIPPDYCLCPSRLDEYTALSGPVCLVDYGLNLQLIAPAAGAYAMTLDETALTFQASLVEAYAASITGTVTAGTAQAPGALSAPAATVYVVRAGGNVLAASAGADPATGAFAAGPLDGGTYNLYFVAPGYLEAAVLGVVVADGGTTDVGTVPMQSGCTTQWSAVQVVGDFNGWNIGTPSMTVNGCVWEDTLLVAAGCHYMKFRTNNDWGNDYGTCTAQDPSCTVPLTGATCLVSGELALGRIQFPATDEYRFVLDELNRTYVIQPLGTPVRTTTWGRLKLRYR